MRKIIIAVTLFMLSATLVRGQIVLKPQATGTVKKLYEIHSVCVRISAGYWQCTPTYQNVEYNLESPGIQAGYGFSNQMWSYSTWKGYTYRFYNYTQGILEFDIQNTKDGAAFPPPGMTENNWTARLVDMDCIQHGGANIGLYDLQDHFEDGNITTSEFEAYSELIVEGIQFDEIDVTEVLRHDLFGSGTGGITSGFLLKSGNGLKIYNHDSPRIEVNGTWPTATPTATPTPHPAVEPGVELYLSQTTFSQGDQFKLDVAFTKSDTKIYRDVPFVLMLDVLGQYYWYPSWESDFQYILIDLDSGIVNLTVIDFIWPHVAGTAGDITFYGALLNSEVNEIFGRWDSTSFGWD
ncbi:hypothetical protein K8T06_08530 [bacterium]|nr:hypothetical protein [bacterium]